MSCVVFKAQVTITHIDTVRGLDSSPAYWSLLPYNTIGDSWSLDVLHVFIRLPACNAHRHAHVHQGL